MRQLKFRVWDNDQKQFHYFELHNITVPDRLLVQDKYPVQQYTGLKDKNGVEIYEGDIIQYNVGSSYDHMDFEVKFAEESLGWIFQSKTGEVLVDEWTPNGNRFSFIEVIGNVFDAP